MNLQNESQKLGQSFVKVRSYVAEEAGSHQLWTGKATLQVWQQNLAVKGANVGQVAKEDVGFFGQLKRHRLVRIHHSIPVALNWKPVKQNQQLLSIHSFIYL